MRKKMGKKATAGAAAAGLVLASLLGMPLHGAAAPVPEVKVNGVDGPLTLFDYETLSVTVSLDPDDQAGSPVDYWLLVSTPSAPPGNWLHYERGSWEPGIAPSYQGPCRNLGAKEVFKARNLPPGDYVFYFGVDLAMNGKLDKGSIFYDKAEVTVTRIDCAFDLGVWRLVYDWEPIGDPDYIYLNFHADGTWNSQYDTGTWEKDFCRIDWWFDGKTTHYWGQIATYGSDMWGEMEVPGVIQGIWEARTYGFSPGEVMGVGALGPDGSPWGGGPSASLP